MNRRTRPSLRRLLNFTAISAVGSGLLASVNLGWTAFAHHDSERRDASVAIWERRETAYARLLAISARAASAKRTPDEYVQLHREYYEALGPFEIYGTSELQSCTIEMRDMLYACAHADDPNFNKSCDSGRLHRLHLRLGTEARYSLARTWNQHPSQFAEDRFAIEGCHTD